MKKAITACLGLLAFAAFIVPATASATNDPQLTHPTGTLLAPEALITATNVGNTLLENTSGGTQLTCTTATMTGKLTKNKASTVEGNISSAHFTGTGAGLTCTGVFNATVEPIVSAAAPWCLRSGAGQATDEFVVLGGECEAAAPSKIKFNLITGVTKCEYQSTKTTAVRGEYTTHSTGDAVLTTPRAGQAPTNDGGFEEINKKVLCPDWGALRMSFTLETDTTASADPLYIS